jgi:hypothetical protein
MLKLTHEIDSDQTDGWLSLMLTGSIGAFCNSWLYVSDAKKATLHWVLPTSVNYVELTPLGNTSTPSLPLTRFQVTVLLFEFGHPQWWHCCGLYNKTVHIFYMFRFWIRNSYLRMKYLLSQHPLRDGFITKIFNGFFYSMHRPQLLLSIGLSFSKIT